MMTNDFVQIGVVAKNEVIKCIRGRKFLISVSIVALVFLLVTGLQFLTDNWDDLKNMGDLANTYLNTLPLVISLVVALLSSIALVSEFEERTALILFTRPIRRTTILLGKILCCFLVESFILLVYFILVTVVGVIKVDGISMADIATSFGVAVLYAFAASGIAFIISAFFKKGSVCTIISLLVLLVIMPISSAMVSSDGGDNWYMLDEAGNTVYTCIPEYIDQYNEGAEQISNVMQSAANILSGFTGDDLSDAMGWIDSSIQSPEFQDLPEDTQKSIMHLRELFNERATEGIDSMVRVLDIIISSNLLAQKDYPDVPREAAVLIVWGIIGYFIAWIKFVRREF